MQAPRVSNRPERYSVKTGLLNLAIGIVLAGLGSTGKYKFPIGDSKTVMVIGGVVAVIGVYQIIRGLARRKSQE